MGFGFMTQNKIYAVGLFVLCFSSVATGQNRKTPDTSGVIAVSEAVLREGSSFLSKPLFKLRYGTRVNKVTNRNGWVQIRHEDKLGWLPESALQDGVYILREVGRGGKTSTSMYKNEVATAGKGFSPEYEDMMKNREGKLNYEDVNALEEKAFETSELVKFAREVRLNSDVFK